MKEKNIPGRILIYTFLGFIILSFFGIWVDHKMGWDHERVIKNQGVIAC